jgi:hypothetical protein
MRTKSFYAALILMVLVPSTLTAATVTLLPVSDAAGADQPIDGDFNLFYPDNPLYLIGFNSNAEYRSISEFSLSSIPAGSTITSAKLTLHAVAGFNATSMGVFTRLFAGNGVAEASDLIQSGSQAGPVVASLGSSAELEYTTAFQTLFASGSPFAAFTILGTGGGVLEFGGRSYVNQAARPTLLVTYTPVPEPASIALAVVGIAMIQLRRQLVRKQ